MTICIESAAHFAVLMDELKHCASVFVPPHDASAVSAAEWLDQGCKDQQFPLSLDTNPLPYGAYSALVDALAQVRELRPYRRNY